MIDSAVLHHIMKKTLWLIWKFRNFEQKEVLDLRSSGKHQSESAKKKVFTFFNDFFTFLRPGFNTIKKLSKYLISKNNLNFLKKNWDLCSPLSELIFHLYILSNFDHLFYEISLFDCWLKIRKKITSFLNRGLSLPP